MPTFNELYLAWRTARRRKRPSHNQLSFESRWLENLISLRDTLQQGEWWPMPAVCFVTTRPKAREIHAPDFADRVVHHWLVPRLESLFEPVFVHDSYSNRKGKGTHAAVDRLQAFMRQVRDGVGGGKGWCLQLDIKNFFNRIHRPTLYDLLKRRLDKTGVPGGTNESRLMRLLCHRLLARHPSQGVRYRGDVALREAVPPHKRLSNAPKGCGLPIGNLTSQFFANVYLNELDQFIKHGLKCKRYVRYVDDFVLVHESREQLVTWLVEIERFLAEHLRLELKEDIRLRPIDAGVDFLGYHLFAHGRRLRKRVIAHCRERLVAWQCRHVVSSGVPVSGTVIHAPPVAVAALRAQLASYQGHFSHASHGGRHAWARLVVDFPWLKALFTTPEKGDFRLRTTPDGVTSYASQVRWFMRCYPWLDCLLVQRGNRYWLHDSATGGIGQCATRDIHALSWWFLAASTKDAPPIDAVTIDSAQSASSCSVPVATVSPGVVSALCRTMVSDGISCGVVAEHGWLRGGMRRRVLVRMQMTA